MRTTDNRNIDDPEGLLALLPFIVAYVLSGRATVLHRRLIKQVKALAGVRTRNRRLIFKTDWRRRLLCAGIDPDTFTVVDEFRWSHAWDELRTTLRFTEKRQTLKVVARQRPIDVVPRAYPVPGKENVQSPPTTVDTTVRSSVSSFIDAKKSGFKQSL